MASGSGPRQDQVSDHARVIVVGGGIVGCSVAYHLARIGWRDTVVLEQNRLAGGTTWHSAGQVGRLRVNRNMTEVNKYSAELYAQLEAETGVATQWKATGSLMLAPSEERMTQLRRTVAMAELFGVEAELVDARFVKDKWPQMRVDDLVGAAWIPGDGKVNAEETTKALAAGATQRGARVLEGVRVEKLLERGNRIIGVQTNQGPMHAEFVVLCGGMWMRQLGLDAGIDIPLYPVEHHYVVTEPLDVIHDDLPMIRDPDAFIYMRPDGNTLMLGGFQAYSKPWMIDRVPDDFAFQLLEDDWPKFADPLAYGKHRLPVLESAKFPRFVNGPESFTPDNNFLLGPVAGKEGCFVAAGFNSAGIACAGGVGKLLAEWIEGGESPCDLWAVDPRRFTPRFNDLNFLRDRVGEVLGWHYAMAWPNREATTGRNLKKSPLYDRLATAGACYGAKMGWERPNFFAPAGETPELRYAWQRQNWFEWSAAEHRATRSNAAIFDQSSFGKYMVEGADSLSLLDWLCSNKIDVPVGQVVYTGLLNRRGTFESDLTVARLAENWFYLVTSTNQVVHDFDWIRRGVPADAQVTITDVTESFGVLGIAGPQSRDILSLVTDAPLDNNSYPFSTVRSLTIANVPVTALRISYTGELGYELHVPMAHMTAVYDRLWRIGQPAGLVNAGHYAINSLRMEKGYCAWGSDISQDESPLEAGLAFALDLTKDFLGKTALLERRQRPLRKRRMVFVLEDPQPVLWGSEPIWRDGRKVGYTTSGAYGHTLGGAVAMGYVPVADSEDVAALTNSQFEIEQDGRRYRSRAYLRAPFDPRGERQRV